MHGFSHAETNTQAFCSTSSSHPWPSLCVWLEHRNTCRCRLTAFVNHRECGGLGSQHSDLFRMHKGGVYSISMVIKPDWKACGHSCECVLVCNLHTHTHTPRGMLGMCSVFFIMLAELEKSVLIACCTHTTLIPNKLDAVYNGNKNKCNHL